MWKVSYPPDLIARIKADFPDEPNLHGMLDAGVPTNCYFRMLKQPIGNDEIVRSIKAGPMAVRALLVKAERNISAKHHLDSIELLNCPWVLGSDEICRACRADLVMGTPFQVQVPRNHRGICTHCGSFLRAS